MPYLVDGDNLLGTWPGRKRSAIERRTLAVELARLGQSQHKQIVIVFDGAAPDGLHFGADVHFAGPTHSADQRILALLEREADKKGWIVVTSDRSLGDRCRSLGARLERSDEFRKRLAGHRGPEKPEREADIDYWLDRFDEKKP